MTREVWVTGADGFIGRHMSHRLAGMGDCAVSALGLRLTPPSANDPAWADWAEGMIDADLLAGLAARRGAPDLIIHLAGGGSVGASFADPWTDFSCTVLSTAAIAEWMRGHAPKTRLIQISSAAVYGAGHDGLIGEDAPQNPYSPYGAHKQMAEALCASATANFGTDTVVVRPFSVYGPGLRKQLLWDVCTRIAGGCDTLTLGGSGGELRDWLHVDDLCTVLLRAGEADVSAGARLNAGTGTAVPVRAIVGMITRAWGRPDMPVAFSGQGRAGDPFALVADPAKLTALGIAKFRDVATGVADYVDWFRGL